MRDLEEFVMELEQTDFSDLMSLAERCYNLALEDACKSAKVDQSNIHPQMRNNFVKIDKKSILKLRIK